MPDLPSAVKRTSGLYEKQVFSDRLKLGFSVASALMAKMRIDPSELTEFKKTVVSLDS
jgi:hypothetical protein